MSIDYGSKIDLIVVDDGTKDDQIITEYIYGFKLKHGISIETLMVIIPCCMYQFVSVLIACILKLFKTKSTRLCVLRSMKLT